MNVDNRLTRTAFHRAYLTDACNVSRFLMFIYQLNNMTRVAMQDYGPLNERTPTREFQVSPFHSYLLTLFLFELYMDIFEIEQLRESCISIFLHVHMLASYRILVRLIIALIRKRENGPKRKG